MSDLGPHREAPVVTDLQRTFHASTRPTIVCLCGSSRFNDEFQRVNYELTMAGQIVLSIGFLPDAAGSRESGEGVRHDSPKKVALDELHKRKIDLADYVYVLDVDGYIGDSTASEIAYSHEHGIPIRYLSQDPPLVPSDPDD